MTYGEDKIEAAEARGTDNRNGTTAYKMNCEWDYGGFKWDSHPMCGLDRAQKGRCDHTIEDSGNRRELFPATVDRHCETDSPQHRRHSKHSKQ